MASHLRHMADRHRVLLAFALLPCIGIVAAFGIAPDTLLERLPSNVVVQDLALTPTQPVADTAPYSREVRIQRGDTVAALLARL